MASRKTHDISDSDDDREVEPTLKIRQKLITNRDSQSSKRKHESSPRAGVDKYVEQGKKHKNDSPKKVKETYVGNNLGFYLTRVRGISDNYNHNGIAYDLKGILLDHDGELMQSVQFNYVFDIPWLVKQYPEKHRTKPLLIVHGEQRESKQALEKSAASFKNVKFCKANLPIVYGTHHTKMMILKYNDGLRIVIHTSNLILQDWDQKTQGIWMSPILPELKSESNDGDSVTNFRKDFLQYLAAYQMPELREWCQIVKKYDFSSIKVFLIGSIPGRHVAASKTSFGHLKLRKILSNHIHELDDFRSWPLIAQFSSIGSLGSSESQWLCSELLSSLTASKSKLTSSLDYSKLNLIFPSVENVRKSLEGYPAGTSLPYSYKTEMKQTYLRRYFCQWSADRTGRTYASPHIKTYLRFSPDCSKIAWFLVTSANLSKAAWGSLEKKGEQLAIRSYELGVLFIPQYLCSSDVFKVEGPGSFPVPYDIPVKKYDTADEPWVWDRPHIKAPDRNGNKWCPP